MGIKATSRKGRHARHAFACRRVLCVCVWRRYVNGCIAGPIKRQYVDYEESLLSKLCSLLSTTAAGKEHTGIFVTISRNI